LQTAGLRPTILAKPLNSLLENPSPARGHSVFDISFNSNASFYK
jgi:hypothetical protein